MNRLTNLLKGQVTCRVESGYPERVLNLCAVHELRFWDLQWESPTAFVMTLNRKDWKRFRHLTEKIDCDSGVVAQRGTPFFMGRLRRRYFLWAGLAVCLCLLIYGSFFIWDFQIEGNRRVSDTEILRALEKNGVGLGTYGLGVNSPILRNDMLLDVPELSYIAVNVRGCRACVQVRERVHPPEMISRRQPGNTVAAKDALVTEVQPWDGEKMVLPGTTVTRGQLLISGVTETEYSGMRYLRGMGRVMGRTWYTLQCKVPLTMWKKTASGEAVTRRALIFGKKRVNLHFNSSHTGDTCDKILHWNHWKLPGNVALPVTVVTETVRPYTLSQHRRPREEAVRSAEEVLLKRLAGYLEEGRVLSCHLDSSVQGDMLLVTLTASCEEQIGKFVELPKE